MLEIHYVWERPVRITHWINVLSIVMLSITGFFIGSPYMTAPETSMYIMGWMRMLHFSFAYLFTVSVAARIIWMFLGNHHASWRAFLPWLNAEGRKDFIQMLRYYTFLSRDLTYEKGHNAVAATAYLGIFALFVFQIVSGFAMYGQFAPGGFWEGMLGGLNAMVGVQWLLLLHHGVMWLLIGFLINHIYSGWLMDAMCRNATMSGIISGYRYVDPEDL